MTTSRALVSPLQGPALFGNEWQPGEEVVTPIQLNTSDTYRIFDGWPTGVPALALMNEVVSFGGPEWPRPFGAVDWGGTFNLDQCLGLFIHHPRSRSGHALHIPDTVNLEELQRLFERLLGPPGEPCTVTLGKGSRTDLKLLSSVRRQLLLASRAVGVHPRIQWLGPSKRKGSDYYLGGLNAYFFDGEFGRFRSVANQALDRLVMTGRASAGTGTRAEMRMSFASGARFLNGTAGMPLIQAFDGQRHPDHPLSHLVDSLLTAEGKRRYRLLSNLDWRRSDWKELAGIILANERVPPLGLDQLAWHFRVVGQAASERRRASPRRRVADGIPVWTSA